MVWARRFWLRLQTLFRCNRSAQRLNDEIQFHLDQQIAENLAGGMSREEARYAAMHTFGNPTYLKEETRGTWGWTWLEQIFGDLRYGARVLRKFPGFTSIAVLTLALGIGANTAIFGVVDSAFLRGLPFREIDRLVYIGTVENDDTHTPTPAQYQAVRDENKSFEQVAAQGWADYFYSADGSFSENLWGALVTPNWFSTLCEQPLLGRNFREEEQQAGQDAVVILSYDFWQTRFHSDPHVIGQQMVLNRRPVTVIGVLPIWSSSKYGPKIFGPLVLNSYANQGDVRAGKVRNEIIARLRRGVTLDQARSEVEVIGEQFKNPSNLADRSQRLVVEDFAQMFRHPGPTVQNAQRGLWMTAVAAGVVLLIACANVASLLLARGVKRHKEVAVRAALGSSRGRMIRQLLTESTLLFLLGGVVALVATRWCEQIITKVASDMVSGVYLQVNARVFIVSLAVSLLSALGFGMIPALHASRVNLNETLKDAGPNAAGGSRSRRLRNGLVAAQIALGMVLLVGFGLLLRSFLHVENSRLGCDPRSVLTVTTRFPFTRYTAPADQVRLMHDAAERMRLMPGVVSVGIADSLPLHGADSAHLRIETPTPKAPVQEEIWFVSVGPGYFSTLKVPMLAGRPFDEQDGQAGSPVGLVLRESLAVTFAGLAFGTLCAFSVMRFFPTEGIGWSGSGIFLYGVSRTDGLTYVSAAALLTSVVIAASWVPARRAMKVDPMVALRYE